jgi:ribonuclease HI
VLYGFGVHEFRKASGKGVTSLVKSAHVHHGFGTLQGNCMSKRGDRKIKKVQLITDGSCIGNPGPGGWACILRYGSGERELSGSEARTTNNRMELAAAINGLRALRESCEVDLVTDSQHLKQGITEHLARWKINGWRTSNRNAVQNQDLWRELDELVSRHVVCWTWVAGHGDHDVQNRCDALAVAAARRGGHSASTMVCGSS